MSVALPYRAGVGIMLFNHEGRVFVAKRIDTMSEAWQMPQGGIDAGEDAKTAALRELEEETGIPQDAVEVLGASASWVRYELPAHLVPKLWGGRFCGQEQKWFAMRLIGPDTLINIATAHPEFNEWRWAALHELPELIVPFKRAMYQALVDELGHHAVA
ncbi:MAG: RNA pyrophosphohydrolase [Alphaproteobacteria bacterium]|nr:RNA pyrophosphohydrolase [Alphaproteobacteria bacterium]